MSIARRSRRTEVNIWPAFVDALGQLVIAIIFLLLIFTVAQFLTTDALSGRDQALQRLTQQINELTDLLNLEKRSNGGPIVSTPGSPMPISASPPTRRRSSCNCASLKACAATSRRCAR